MRYSVLFFVLVNGMIRDSATTSSKATIAAPGPTTITTGSTATSSKATTSAPGPTTITTGSTATSSKATTSAPGPTTITTGSTATSSKATTSAPGPTTITTASTATSSKATTSAPGPTTITTASTARSSKATTAAPGPTTITTGSTARSSKATTAAPGPTTITTASTATATPSSKATTAAPRPTTLTTATTSTKATTSAPGPTTITTSSTATATTSTKATTAAPGPTTITTASTATATTSTKATTAAPGPTTITTASATTSRTMAATTTISLVTGTTTETGQPGSHSTTVTVLNESTTTEINTTDSRETTINSSDSSTAPATSTKQPDTTTKYPGETKDLSSLRINIDLQISLSNAAYNESLEDKSSEIYISYKRSFRTKLYETYEDISGFNHVIINNFSNGSVVCNYTVVVNADSNITVIGDKIANATLNLTTSSLNIDNEVFEIYVNETIVNANIQNVKGRDICNLIDRACETFENCSLDIHTPGKIRCTHKCYSGKNECHNGGSCFYDVRKKSMECKCTKDNDYIYYGPSCIQKAEKFALHKNDIIGLAAGCGGGVVVILLVVIIVLLMKKTRKGKESDLKLDLSREVSIEDIRLHRLSESHSSNGFQNRFEPRAKPNPYETRIPETKFLHGRAHDIYKDSTGEETYIYPSPNYIHPISASGHRDSTKSGQSMYDYIDTESRFEIQRPRIRLGQSSAF